MVLLLCNTSRSTYPKEGWEGYHPHTWAHYQWADSIYLSVLLMGSQRIDTKLHTSIKPEHFMMGKFISDFSQLVGFLICRHSSLGNLLLFDYNDFELECSGNECGQLKAFVMMVCSITTWLKNISMPPLLNMTVVA